MKYLVLLAFAVFFSIAQQASADHRYYYPPVQATSVTEVVNVTELVNTTNIDNYTPDTCQGVAIAMAGSNNTLHFGTDHPQLSLGIGECNSDLASSLMFGMKVNKNMMLNGSWATDNEVNAFGVGVGIIFK